MITQNRTVISFGFKKERVIKGIKSTGKTHYCIMPIVSFG